MPYYSTDILKTVVDNHFLNGVSRVTTETFLALNALTVQEFRHVLRTAGAIPEQYQHDSAEEKAYGKAADVLVACCFERLGMVFEVVVERSDRPDVIA